MGILLVSWVSFDLSVIRQFKREKGLSQYSPFGQAREELPTFEATPFGMRCRLPVAGVDGITIAILLCQTFKQHLGLLLHPAPANQVMDPSRSLYYASWAFSKANANTSSAKRVACLGDDLYNLQFRGKPVNATWRIIYIITHSPTTGRGISAPLVYRFLPDVAPAPFRVPRALLQIMAALQFFPATWTITSDAGSKATVSFKLENVVVNQSLRITFGACIRDSNDGVQRHWAWAEHKDVRTWKDPWKDYAHDCAADHIEDWPDHARDFGSEECTFRLVFAPCPHAPGKTLVLGLELIGPVCEKLQREANVYLPPPLRSPRRLIGDAEALGHATAQVRLLSASLTDVLGCIVVLIRCFLPGIPY